MTYPSPKTGAPVWRAWQIPKSHADLRARRLFRETWAEATFGLMGRTPDHVAGFFAGYAATPQRVRGGGAAEIRRQRRRLLRVMRDNHIYATYAIVPPQIDRSKPAHKQSDPTLYAGVVKERDDGIVISGAQQLATGGAISDYIHLSCIHPLQPGDENYANCVAVPVDAPGRQALSAAAVRAAPAASFDYPLSSRFDESRQLRRVRQRVRAVGARVHLPQHRIVARPVVEDAVASLRQSSGAGALRHQAALHDRPRPAHERDDRQRRASAGADHDGRTRRARVRSTRPCCSRTRRRRRSRTACCGRRRRALYSAMALQSELNGRMLEIIRELAGAAFITLPSSEADFDNPEIAADIERYMRRRRPTPRRASR